MPDTVVEITRMMENQEVLQKDMEEAKTLLNDFFRKKYLQRIHRAVNKHQQKIEQEPSREIQLLKAMRNFCPEDNQQQVDKMIGLMQVMASAQSIQKEISTANNKPAEAPVKIAGLPDPSVHEDGIYDIDHSCMARKKSQGADLPGLMFFMALTKMI